jgi:hypothetical protein
MDKATQRKQVEAALAEFLAKGGKVKKVAYKDKSKEKKAQFKVTA